MATFEIFVHLDVMNRQEWDGDSEGRPLTEIGKAQAEKIADELLARGPVDGVFATDNTRCRQSVEPLAQRLSSQVMSAPGFEPAPRSDDGADALITAYQAGSIFANMSRIAVRNPAARYVICVNGGNIVSSLLAFAAGLNATSIPPKLEISLSSGPAGLRRGNVYTVVMDGAAIQTSQREASRDFPQAASSLA